MSSSEIHKKGKSHFDECAKEFDEDPLTAEMSKKTLEIFKDMDLINKEQECLDFGIGTGKFSLSLIDFVKSIHGVDTSDGMLEILKKNIDEKDLGDRITYENLFLNKPHQLGHMYNLIYTQLTLHHCEDPSTIINLLSTHLLDGGIMVVIELEKTEDSHYFFNATNHKCPSDKDKDGKEENKDKGVFHEGLTIELIEQALRNSEIKPFEPRKFVIEREVRIPEENVEKKMKFNMIVVAGRKMSD